MQDTYLYSFAITINIRHAFRHDHTFFRRVIHFVYNKTAQGVLGDVVDTIYQGVLCLQNVIGFHGTRVSLISFKLRRKMQASVRRILRNYSLTALYADIVPNFKEL